LVRDDLLSFWTLLTLLLLEPTALSATWLSSVFYYSLSLTSSATLALF
jgi:hypothetical protein